MAMAAYMIISIIVSVLISAALAPKPTEPKAATFEDFDIPQVSEGTPQSVGFGEFWSGDWQVLGFGNLRTKKVKAKSAKK